ncbi:MAG: hypothetical protein ACQESK_07635 [Bacteroidota bacterium]
MDASVAETPSCSSDSYFYFKVTDFNLIIDPIPYYYIGFIPNIYYRVLKKERPIIILVIVSALLFLIHQYLQMQAQINITFLDNYIDPIVLMPLILYAVLWERRIFLRNRNIVLTYIDILGYFLLMVLFGEVLFPIFSDKFTADYWDILAYAFGTLAYVVAKEASKETQGKNKKV